MKRAHLDWSLAVTSGSLYRALKAGNVPDDLAQKAAEDAANFSARFHRVELDTSPLRSDLRLFNWMVGLVLAGIAATMMKSLF